jgi:hypothetical protein
MKRCLAATATVPIAKAGAAPAQGDPGLRAELAR